MTTLVLGGTGATGKHLIAQLLGRNESVRAIVRDKTRVPQQLRDDDKLEIIEASVLQLDDNELSEAVANCDAVACCLGHNLSFQGIYGQPRRLVTDVVRRICAAIAKRPGDRPVRFVLMNTAGNQNRDLDEPIGLSERLLLGLIRVALPPHPDNEAAADFLRTQVGRTNNAIEWVVVRPDSLIDENDVSAFSAHPSPTRSALFNPGKTSRINVGEFMARLATGDDTWQKWKGQMPVVYNEQT